MGTDTLLASNGESECSLEGSQGFSDDDDDESWELMKDGDPSLAKKTSISRSHF